jgi:hypothetical protein
MTASLVVAARFCGPPGSANGGYACGLIAGCLDGQAEITLRRPRPGILSARRPGRAR